MGRKTALLSLVGFVALLCLAPSFSPGFDGRLPAGIGEPLDPGGAVPEHARAFLEAFGESFDVYWDHRLETPRLIAVKASAAVAVASGLDEMGAGSERRVYMESSSRRFLEENREFFGCGVENLSGPEIVDIGRHWLLLFEERCGGIPIRGANVRMLLGEDGRLLAVKSYLLRELPAPAAPLADAGPAFAALRQRGYEVLGDPEAQLVFSSPELSSSRPRWRFEVRTPGDIPAEVILEPESGAVVDERWFVHELGIEGQFRGDYPNPDETDPDFFFKRPEEHEDHPVMEALVKGDSDMTSTDDAGAFRLFDENGTAFVSWSLRAGTCRDDAWVLQREENGQEVTTCPNNRFSLDEVLDLRLVMMDEPEWPAPLTRRENERVVFGESLVATTPEVSADFALRGSGGEDSRLISARLMGFRHILRFLHHAEEVLEKELQTPPVSWRALQAWILPQSENLRHYTADRTRPRIVFSTSLRRRGVPADDPHEPRTSVTPTLLNHEVGHHLIFAITGYRYGYSYDCHASESPSDCLSRTEPLDAIDAQRLGALNPKERQDASFIEGLADALAAYYADLPRFGFIEKGELPQPISYDISRGDDPRIPDERRRLVAKFLWDVRMALREGLSLPRDANQIGQKNLQSEKLLYHWLLFHRALSDTWLTFEFGPALLAELILMDRLVNGGLNDSKILSVIHRHSLTGHASFRRGDANQDGQLDLSDAASTLNYLFLGGFFKPCHDALDVNDSGGLDLSDAVALLQFLFQGGPPPAAPHPICGQDPSDDAIFCHSYAAACDAEGE
jgi:hypothetical protein